MTNVYNATQRELGGGSITGNELAVDEVAADTPSCPARDYQEPCPSPMSCSDGCKRLGSALLLNAASLELSLGVS